MRTLKKNEIPENVELKNIRTTRDRSLGKFSKRPDNVSKNVFSLISILNVFGSLIDFSFSHKRKQLNYAITLLIL